MKVRSGHIKAFVIVFAVLIMSIGLATDKEKPPGAELIKTRNGISLYERWIELSNGDEAREVLLKFSVNASPNVVLDFIRDAQKIPQWNTSIKSSEMLEHSHNSWIHYIRYSIPWPLNDQDCILQHRIIRRSKTAFQIEYSSITHASRPPLKKVERLQQVSGRWEVSEKDGKTWILYTAISAPSQIPRRITDPLIREIFISSMENFTLLLDK